MKVETKMPDDNAISTYITEDFEWYYRNGNEPMTRQGKNPLKIGKSIEHSLFVIGFTKQMSDTIVFADIKGQLSR